MLNTYDVNIFWRHNKGIALWKRMWTLFYGEFAIHENINVLVFVCAQIGGSTHHFRL